MSLVAAQRVSCRNRVDQTIREVAIGVLARLERLRDCFDHLRPDEDIPLGHIVFTGAMSLPILRTGAGMLSGTTLDVDDADLAALGAGVGGEKTLERGVRGFAPGESVEQLVAVLGARVRLRRDRTDALPYPGHPVADARNAGRHRRADFPSARVDRRDRERVKDERVAPRVWLLRGEKGRCRDECSEYESGFHEFL